MTEISQDHEAAPVALVEYIAALEGALAEWGRNVCTHEETTRGGLIWTFCSGCGMKWADDEGGFKPYQEPARITYAFDILARARAALSPAPTEGEA